MADSASLAPFVARLEQTLRREKLRSIEIRPVQPLQAITGLCHSTESFCHHHIDLRPDLPTLFANCHKSSTQRKVTRAEQEGLNYESGRSEPLLAAFWDLLLITRRRHGVPPQPKAWFHNLIRCFGDRLDIRVARKDNVPVASILTIRHNRTLAYKYGCSDARFHNLGGTQLLFWRSIQDAKRDGLETFDLGRTDWNNAGLLRFKDRWGASRSTLVYSHFSLAPVSGTSPRWYDRIRRAAIPHLPAFVLRMAGRALYRHMA
jgi:lipid II:glycine glycyltransferase (peptidoglycan interpeptide bridge formation enzyme)